MGDSELEAAAQLVISGATYSAVIEGSAVPAEENWPAPRVIRRGRGRSYVYDVNHAERGLIIGFLADFESCMGGMDSDVETQRDRSAIRRDLRRAGVAL